MQKQQSSTSGGDSSRALPIADVMKLPNMPASNATISTALADILNGKKKSFSVSLETQKNFYLIFFRINLLAMYATTTLPVYSLNWWQLSMKHKKYMPCNEVCYIYSVYLIYVCVFVRRHTDSRWKFVMTIILMEPFMWPIKINNLTTICLQTIFLFFGCWYFGQTTWKIIIALRHRHPFRRCLIICAIKSEKTTQWKLINCVWIYLSHNY